MLLRLFCPILAFAAAVSAASSTSEGQNLNDLVTGLRWVSYAPTNYFPAERPPVLPGDASVQEDLETLHSAGFTGLITYGAQVENVPRIARNIGFTAMLLGIWDPLSVAERSEALKAVRENSGLIAGLIVGNEGLLTGRYNIGMLCRAMGEIKLASGKPVSTTEPVDWLLSEPQLATCSSFITANAHPYFSHQKAPAQAVQWTVEAWNAVRSKYPDKPLLFKEVGLPSAGHDGLSEEAQKEYYMALAKTPVVFSYFEAFDATPRFKEGLLEQSWGLWRSDRRPKAVVQALPWREETR
jgi:exo-beta-1,3-glucanase (GH17 family)